MATEGLGGEEGVGGGVWVEWLWVGISGWEGFGGCNGCGGCYCFLVV